MSGFVTRAERAVSHPLVSYALIAALQLRVIWNVWKYKDLTYGDTSNYFINAASWMHGLHDNVVYSPLYSAAWGTILAIVHDVYAAAMVNRIAIVFAAAMLFLAAMRAVLPPAIALLIALWWTVNPASYNVLYDVHLLGVLPVLLAAVMVRWMPGRRGLGIALGLLAGDIVLLRNEMLLTTLIFGAMVVVYELRHRRSSPVPAMAYAKAYGIPLLVALLLIGGAYGRSYVQGHTAVASLEDKQETNLCEAYAFSYQQRYPQRVSGNAFLGCQAVMRHDFGRPKPSLAQAVGANPRAMAGFVAWNIRLLPSGTEAALFNATRTGDNPGYPPPSQHQAYAGILALVLCLLIVVGGIELWRQRDYWRREWFPRAGWSAGVLACAAAGTLIIVLTERPWIDYMYAVTVFVLALAGLSAAALLRRFGIARGTALVAVGLAVILIAALPSYYSRAPRPIHDAVARVQAIRHQLQRQGSVLAASQYGNEICSYLAYDYRSYCTSVSWADLRGQVEAGIPLERALARARVTAIYAEAGLLADPLIAPLIASPTRAGWRLAAGGSPPDGPWRLLVRAQAGAAA